MKLISLEKYHLIALVGWFSRGLVVLLSILNIRLIIELIGIEGFGLHAFLLNLLPWLFLLHFGVPYTIQNKISQCRSDGLSYSAFIDFGNKFVFITLVMLVFASAIIVYFLKSLDSFNSISYFSIWSIIMLIALNAVIELYNRVLYSEHKGYWPNIFPAISMVMSTCGIGILYLLELKDIELVFLVYFLPTLLILYMSYYLVNKNHTPKREGGVITIRSALKLSLGFFIFNVMATVVLKIDYFIIFHLFGEMELGIYALVQKYYLTVLFLYSVILAALWPHLSEAMNLKDIKRVNSLVAQNILIGIIVAAIFILIFYFYHKEILALLVGKDVPISLSIIVFASIYLLIRVYTDVFTTFLMSIGDTKVLNYFVFIQAVLTIAAEYYFASQYGLMGIFIGLIIAFIFTTCWILPVLYIKNLRNIRELR